MPRRIVKVFVVDPDEHVPLDNALLYQSSDFKFTDATDQELYFEIDIKGVLKKHNEKRGTIEDKKHKGEKVKYLDPIRVRDLVMTVVTLASFPTKEEEDDE